MSELITNTAFGATLLTIAAYLLGTLIRRKFNFAIFNPVIIAVGVVIAVLVFTGTGYDGYFARCDFINALITPATVCLAVPLYKQLQALRRNWAAILGGIFAGVLTSAVSVFIVARLFAMTHESYVTLLPKSLTTAIGMVISQELGGIAAVTVVAIMVTGLVGNIAAELVLRLFHITDPVAAGVAIGTSSHILGTTKAVELGEVQGAMSGLSIAVAGLLTVVLSPVFASLIA